MTRCLICERRPAKQDGFCPTCASKVDKLRRVNGKAQPKYYLTYKGIVVGLFPDGGGALRAELLKRNPAILPKTKTFDLNRYCQGFTREQIKRFKACCLQLAHA